MAETLAQLQKDRASLKDAIDKLPGAITNQTLICVGVGKNLQPCKDAEALVIKYQNIIKANPGGLAEIDAKIADLQQGGSGSMSTGMKAFLWILGLGALVGGYFFGKNKGWWGKPKAA